MLFSQFHVKSRVISTGFTCQMEIYFIVFSASTLTDGYLTKSVTRLKTHVILNRAWPFCNNCANWTLDGLMWLLVLCAHKLSSYRHIDTFGRMQGSRDLHCFVFSSIVGDHDMPMVLICCCGMLWYCMSIGKPEHQDLQIQPVGEMFIWFVLPKYFLLGSTDSFNLLWSYVQRH
jgi:hypothetical protein